MSGRRSLKRRGTASQSGSQQSLRSPSPIKKLSKSFNKIENKLNASGQGKEKEKKDMMLPQNKTSTRLRLALNAKFYSLNRRTNIKFGYSMFYSDNKLMREFLDYVDELYKILQQAPYNHWSETKRLAARRQWILETCQGFSPSKTFIRALLGAETTGDRAIKNGRSNLEFSRGDILRMSSGLAEITTGNFPPEEQFFSLLKKMAKHALSNTKRADDECVENFVNHLFVLRNKFSSSPPLSRDEFDKSIKDNEREMESDIPQKSPVRKRRSTVYLIPSSDVKEKGPLRSPVRRRRSTVYSIPSSDVKEKGPLRRHRSIHVTSTSPPSIFSFYEPCSEDHLNNRVQDLDHDSGKNQVVSMFTEAELNSNKEISGVEEIYKLDSDESAEQTEGILRHVVVDDMSDDTKFSNYTRTNLSQDIDEDDLKYDPSQQMLVSDKDTAELLENENSGRGVSINENPEAKKELPVLSITTLEESQLTRPIDVEHICTKNEEFDVSANSINENPEAKKELPVLSITTLEESQLTRPIDVEHICSKNKELDVSANSINENQKPDKELDAILDVQYEESQFTHVTVEGSIYAEQLNIKECTFVSEAISNWQQNGLRDTSVNQILFSDMKKDSQKNEPVPDAHGLSQSEEPYQLNGPQKNHSFYSNTSTLNVSNDVEYIETIKREIEDDEISVGAVINEFGQKIRKAIDKRNVNQSSIVNTNSGSHIRDGLTKNEEKKVALIARTVAYLNAVLIDLDFDSSLVIKAFMEDLTLVDRLSLEPWTFLDELSRTETAARPISPEIGDALRNVVVDLFLVSLISGSKYYEMLKRLQSISDYTKQHRNAILMERSQGSFDKSNNVLGEELVKDDNA